MAEQEKDITPLLHAIAQVVLLKAKRFCPLDLGPLRASLQYKIEGNTIVIYSDLPYAKDIEFGTPPGKLDDQEQAELGEWAERHGLPKGPVISKIEREGIKVGTMQSPLKTPSGFRPFLRPAIHQSRKEIKELVEAFYGNH